MNNRFFRWARCAIISIFFVSALPLSTQAAAPVNSSDIQTLVQKLQKGGYVIYIRHAATDHDKVDQDGTNLKDCATQRNLSENGRQQAREIGTAIAALNILIGKVTSSPYCRCIDTATLAFGKAEVSPDLAFSITKDEDDTKRLGKSLQRMLATAPAANTNNVIVAHTSNLKTAAGIWPKPEGVVVIFEPLEDQRFFYIGKIGPDEWGQFLDSQ